MLKNILKKKQQRDGAKQTSQIIIIHRHHAKGSTVHYTHTHIKSSRKLFSRSRISKLEKTTFIEDANIRPKI